MHKLLKKAFEKDLMNICLSSNLKYQVKGICKVAVGLRKNNSTFDNFLTQSRVKNALISAF